MSLADETTEGPQFPLNVIIYLLFSHINNSIYIEA